MLKVCHDVYRVEINMCTYVTHAFVYLDVHTRVRMYTRKRMHTSTRSDMRNEIKTIWSYKYIYLPNLYTYAPTHTLQWQLLPVPVYD